MYLPPGHPIIAIRNNSNRNGRRKGKKGLFGSTQELSSSSLYGKIDCGATSIQMSNFHKMHEFV